jgi:hypothetical protein
VPGSPRPGKPTLPSYLRQYGTHEISGGPLMHFKAEEKGLLTLFDVHITHVYVAVSTERTLYDKCVERCKTDPLFSNNLEQTRMVC